MDKTYLLAVAGWLPNGVRIRILEWLWRTNLPSAIRRLLARVFYWSPFRYSGTEIKILAPRFALELNPQDHVERAIFYMGCWEPEITDYVLTALKPGDGFIDAGAHVGYYTCLFARLVGPRGWGVAFEPNRQSFLRLNSNVALNQLGNVKCQNAALSDGASSLVVCPGDDGNLGLTRTSTNLENRPPGSYLVRAGTLSSFVEPEDLKRVRLVKIDIEGDELGVIREMLPFLKSCRHDLELIVEVSSATAAMLKLKVKELVALLAEGGHRAFTLGNGYTLSYYRPDRLTRAPRSLDLEGEMSTSEIEFEQFGHSVDLLFSRRDPVVLACTGVPFRDVLRRQGGLI